MLFTGGPISAHDALLHGLVSKVVPEERLEEETLAIARRVCQSSRPVVALGKATFHRYLHTFKPSSKCHMTDLQSTRFINRSVGIRNGCTVLNLTINSNIPCVKT